MLIKKIYVKKTCYKPITFKLSQAKANNNSIKFH